MSWQDSKSNSIIERLNNWLSEDKTIFIFLIIFIIFWSHYFYQIKIEFFYGFLSEFVAGGLGVFLAFYLNRIIEKAKNKKLKKNLLQDLREELEEIKGKLTGQGHLLYPDIWRSAISSGQIRLLDSNQVNRLAKVYRKIQGLEYEAKRVRDAAEDLRRMGPLVSDKERRLLHQRWADYSQILNNLEKELYKMIEEVLKEEWWNP